MLAPAARVLFRGAALAFSLASIGCRERSDRSAPTASVVAALPPVDEPANLGATLVVKDGGETWAHVRALAGERAGLAPVSLGGAVAFAVGLPVTTAELFSEHDPVVGALAEPSLLSPARGVVAFHLRGADRLIALATQGAGAAFVSHRDEASSADLLEPIGAADGKAKGAAALGVFGNYLVVGTDAEALRELGPYATRNLASRPAPGEAASIHLGSGLLRLAAPVLAARVAGLGGGPASLLGKTALTDLLDRARAADGADATIDAGDEGLAITCALQQGGAKSAAPPSAAIAAPASRGAARALLDLPLTAHVGVVAYEPAERRRAEEASVDASVAGVLDAPDASAFEAAFAALTAARGDGFTLGFEDGLLGQAFYGRVAIADRDGASKALAALVDVAEKKTVADVLAKRRVALSAKETVVERVGDVVRVRLGAATDESKGMAASGPAAVNLLARMNADGLTLGSGADATAALRAMLDGPRLVTEPTAEAIVSKLPAEVAFAALADPARMMHGATVARSWVAGAIVEETGATRASVVADARGVQAILEAISR